MEQKLIFTVSQLNELVKMTLESSPLLDHVTLRGEISNFTNHYRTGHYYFSLKDASAAVRAVMFATNAAKCRFLPENGMMVLATGRVSAYVRDGQYQLYVDSMEPDGIGSLTVAFEQLKAKLEKEGLFRPERKRPLPKFPHTVGIVTSPTGAAVRDIINIATRRSPGTKLLLFPAQVQGASAAGQLTSGVLYLNRMHLCDVIIIGRGGGSLEDLWAFNDETLARAIAASEIPVISAVGHETDFSICDFVADLRAPTPSAAAELALPDMSQCTASLLQQKARMQAAMLLRLRTQQEKLKELAQRRVLRSAAVYIDDRRLDLDRVEDRINSLQNAFLSRCGEALQTVNAALYKSAGTAILQKRALLSEKVARLDALSPLAVLRRGYSAVFSGDGHAVKSITELAPASEITLQLADGTADAVITTVQKEIKHGKKSTEL